VKDFGRNADAAAVRGCLLASADEVSSARVEELYGPRLAVSNDRAETGDLRDPFLLELVGPVSQ
jgi:hypothetical protein